MVVENIKGVIYRTNLLFPVIQILSVLYTIFKDKFLKNHYGLALFACFNFLLICLILIFSTICKLRRKPKAKNNRIWMLEDSDLESEDERKIPTTDRKPPEAVWKLVTKNCVSLCKFRPIYGVIAATGIIFFVLFVGFEIASLIVEEPFMKEDLYLAGMEIVTPAVVLSLVVFITANMPKIYDPQPVRMSYEPFEEIVKVPSKIIAGKALTIAFENPWRICHLICSFIYTAFTIYALSNVYKMPDEEIERLKEVTKLKNIYSIIFFIIGLAHISGLALLFGSIVPAYLKTRQSLLTIFEKNFERNINAIEFILQTSEVETLEDLQTAVTIKRSEPLTMREKLAFEYITRPFWKTKRAFMDKPVRDLNSTSESTDHLSEFSTENPQAPGLLRRPSPRAMDPEVAGPSREPVPRAMDPEVAGPSREPVPRAMDSQAAGPSREPAPRALDPEVAELSRVLRLSSMRKKHSV